LLLDEPTNDLDIETLKWLENFIVNTNKPIIFVSHDRKYISEVCQKAYALDKNGLHQIDIETAINGDFN